MKTKEEYVKFVKEWKIEHEALIKLQLYVKRYLIKTEYPNEKYKLSDEEIKKCLTILEPNHSRGNLYWPLKVSNLERWNPKKQYCGTASCFKELLRSELHHMYTVRFFEKERFKESQLETAEV